MCFKWLSEWKMFRRRVGQTKGVSALAFIGLFCTHLTSLSEARPARPWEDDKEAGGRVQTARQARSHHPPSGGGVMARDAEQPGPQMGPALAPGALQVEQNTGLASIV